MATAATISMIGVTVPKITELTDNALGRAVMWPEGVPRYTLASAQLNGALQFGLDRTT